MQNISQTIEGVFKKHYENEPVFQNLFQGALTPCFILLCKILAKENGFVTDKTLFIKTESAFWSLVTFSYVVIGNGDTVASVLIVGETQNQPLSSRYSYSKPAVFFVFKKNPNRQTDVQQLNSLWRKCKQQRKLQNVCKNFIASGLKSLFQKAIIFSCTVLVY